MQAAFHPGCSKHATASPSTHRKKPMAKVMGECKFDQYHLGDFDES